MSETTHSVSWVLWEEFPTRGFATEREGRTGSIQRSGKGDTQWKEFGMKTRPCNSGPPKLGRSLKTSSNLTSSYYWWEAWDTEISMDLLKAIQQVGGRTRTYIYKTVLHHHVLMGPGPARIVWSQWATWREGKGNTMTTDWALCVPITTGVTFRMFKPLLFAK